MIITLNEVTFRTQALLDDPTGAQFDAGYLATIVNQRYDDMIIELDQLDLTYEEVVAVITPFAAGTTDLSSYEADGNSLQAILDPESLDWRLPAELDSQYKPIKRTDKLPDVDANTVPGISAYEWRGGVVYVTPSSVDVTLRVRYQAMSTNLVDPSDKVLRGVTNILAYKVAELAAALRGGDGGAKLATRYGAMGQQAMDNFEVLMVKKDQEQTRRVRRMSRPSGRRLFVAH